MKTRDELTFHERKILTVFAESYPASAQYRGGRKLRKGEWDRIFPQLGTSVDEKNDFLHAVERLTDGKIISVSWQRFREGDSVAALYLEDPAALYEALALESPEEHKARISDYLRSYRPENEMSRLLKEYLSGLCSREDTVIDESLDDVRDILRLSELDTAEAGRNNIRAISVGIFRDSKRIEKIIGKADRLCSRAGMVELSKNLGLVRSYPDTAIGGDCVLRFSDGTSFDLRGKIVTLPAKTVSQIKEITFNQKSPRLLSVENKETFFVLSGRPGNFDCHVYCGGRLNGADRALLEVAAQSGAAIYHTGDLDPDGLQIFQDIENVTGGLALPYMMDIETYERYFDFSYELTPASLKHLKSITSPKIKQLADLIEHRGRGVEQEIIAYP